MTPRMVMPPFKPQLNGTDISGVKDPDGKALFVEMTELVKRHGRVVRHQLGGEPARAARQVERFAEGDLTQAIHSESQQPGNLLGAFANMRAKLHDIVENINRGAETLSRESGELSVAAREISLASGNQAESSAATASSVEELTVSINEVSEIARATEANSGQGADVEYFKV